MSGRRNKGSQSEKTAEESWCTRGSMVRFGIGSSSNAGDLDLMFSRDPAVRSAFVRANNEADDIIEKILEDLESGKSEPPPVSYEDPCQSPVVDVYETHLLREKWNSMMDMPLSSSIHNRFTSSKNKLGIVTICPRPKLFEMNYFSPVFMAAYLGNYDDFIKIIDKLSKSEIGRLLNKREGYLQFNPIFLPIIGAKIFHDPEKVKEIQKEDDKRRPYLERSQRMHMELLEKLVELNADVNVHDLAGYTPLYHCFIGGKTDYTVKMAEFLLKNGANMNAVNRFGDAPLIECVQKKNEEHIKLLISYKANPLLKNYEGRTALSYAAKKYPEICALLKEGVKNVVEESWDKFQVCDKCKGFAKNRCSACLLVWYCGPACQKSDWIAHKATCKRMRANKQQ